MSTTNENASPSTNIPELKQSKSSVEKIAAELTERVVAAAEMSASADVVAEVSKSSVEKIAAAESDVVAQYKAALDAWATGRFNIPEQRDEAVAEFFTKDLIYDVKSAAGHTSLPAMKKIYGFENVKDLFDFFGTFDFESMTNHVVPGSQPNEVWHLLEATATHKQTGKSAPLCRLCVATLEGGKIRKLVQAMHDPGSAAAISQEEDVSFPAVAKLPAFEPHPDPKSVFADILALWGAGEFSKPDTKHATMAKWFAADVVIDATNSAAPDELKAYYGAEGLDSWVDGVWSQTFELSNLAAGPVVDVKPGCVLWKNTCDAKRKATGKEAAGVELYAEAGINAAGQVAYQRFFYVNPEGLAR